MFARRVKGDEQAITPSLRYEVFGVVAAHGGKAELEALLNIWNTSKNDDEKYLAVECLAEPASRSLSSGSSPRPSRGMWEGKM